MLSFMGQGQLGKLGKLDKLATFACYKRILENPKCQASSGQVTNVGSSKNSSSLNMANRMTYLWAKTITNLWQNAKIKYCNF